ncbi:phage tail tape measure protein [Blastococcus xanthinilyticus]|uniref:TP901 family phage tail tape measure protein n=1 Tax=Blastococcus xanthinilyticus TaxID=1564164 RepID=A0A5S5CR07_9ACTN|nr:phage tail tape measure protein [Blastococcus xanthinilyticus]TYP82076.1 TP901 family phage tail tape measure protein [Blastococcus xanthinilyticus]
MADRSVLVRLQANIADFRQQMQQAERSVKGVGDESERTSRQATTSLGRMAESAQKNRGAWDDAGTALAGFGVVTVAALGATVKAAVDWESAWAGVTKTVSGTPRQLGEIEQGLRGLARTLPATHGEIAAVAEAAGQLGVKTDSIVAFTRTMVDLGETTNLSADEAATSLAQLMNVMQTAPDDVGRLGAALVALGNAGASTEADIVNMASYLTGSAKLIGASESDVLALANAMTSMGINAERGGGVMTRVMQDVYAAVQTGGDKLEGFADVAGMSAGEFAAAFEADPIRAIDAFVQGLNGVEKSGGNVVATLNDLGYKGTQDTAVLLQMKGAGDLLTESLDLGSRAWEQNSALVEEAAKRYDTTAGQLAIAKNNVHDAAIEIGEVFLPVLADLAGGLADIAGWFADLPEPVQATLGGLAGIAGVAALAGGAFLLLFPRAIETYKAFQTLRDVSPGTASALGKVGKAAGIAGGFIAAASAVDALMQSMGPAPATMEETTAALLGMGTSLGSIDEQFRGLSAAGYEIESFADAADRLINPGFMDQLNNVASSPLFWTETWDEGSAGRTRLIKQLGQIGDSLALMVENGNVELAAETFGALGDVWEEQGGDLEDLRNLMPAYTEALTGVKNEQTVAAQSAQQQAESTALLAQNLEASYGSLEGYAAALGLSEDATEELRAKTEELGASLAAFINPLGVYTGLLDEKKAAEEAAAIKAAEEAGKGADAWRDFVVDTGFSFEEYMQRLRDQVTAQENWQLNMLVLAGRVSQGTLDELARMGPEGAPLVADLVNRSDAELDEFDVIMAARAKEATDAWGAQFTMAAPVLAELSRKMGADVAAGVAAELQAGTTTIAQVVDRYGLTIVGGINPILGALGKPQISHMATGRGYQAYADGGVEDHTAQIAPAGAMRLWAEPETGGEAYIPLSPAKRTRSVDIWRQVGDRLGVQFQEFADGGFRDETDVPRPRSTAPFRMPLSTAADAAMQTEYDAAVAWLRENGSGRLGTGAVGGSWRDLWAMTQAAFPQAKLNSSVRNTNDAHGRGKAIDVGLQGVPGGAGNAYMARMNRWWYDNHGANLYELIYDGLGDDRPDIKRGQDHKYSPATEADHEDHVHIASYLRGAIVDFLKPGSLFNPHVRDSGGPLLPGFTFNGTGGTETVVPNSRLVDAGLSATATAPIDYDRLGAVVARHAQSLTVVTRDNPTSVIRAVQAHNQQQAALAPAWT